MSFVDSFKRISNSYPRFKLAYELVLENIDDPKKYRVDCEAFLELILDYELKIDKLLNQINESNKVALKHYEEAERLMRHVNKKKFEEEIKEHIETADSISTSNSVIKALQQDMKAIKSLEKMLPNWFQLKEQYNQKQEYSQSKMSKPLKRPLGYMLRCPMCGWKFKVNDKPNSYNRCKKCGATMETWIIT